MNMVSFANRFSPDSSVVLGVLGLKVVRYVNEGNSRQATVIPNLRIRSTRSNDIPIYHVSTGLYGFLKLKPGTHRLHITDPQNRYLPRAISIIDVPDHNSVRRMLENGITPPDNATAPLYKTVLLRPGQDYPLPPGETALWGRILSNAGVPTVYTRIEVTTQHNLTATKVITYADQNGIYFARLPGERAKFAEPAEPSPEGERVGPPDDSSQSPEGELTKTFDRSIAVYTLKKDQAFETDPLNRFPADFDDLNPEDALGPYQPAQFRLINPVSQEQRNANDGNPPQPTIIVGKRTRWDIVIV